MDQVFRNGKVEKEFLLEKIFLLEKEFPLEKEFQPEKEFPQVYGLGLFCGPCCASAVERTRIK